VGRQPPQRLAAHHHAGPAHAEVLVGAERERAELGLVAEAGLAQEVGVRGVEAAQQPLQRLRPDVQVVVGAHEPLEALQVVVVQELEHHERLLLRRVGLGEQRGKWENERSGGGNGISGIGNGVGAELCRE